MAYTANEFLVVIEGTLQSSEVWSNTWAVLDTVGGQSRQDAVDSFHQMYVDLKADLSNDWNALTATTRELLGNTSTPRAFEDIVGVRTGDNLPTECAVRISLNDQNGHNGGPFIGGFTVNVINSDGTLASTQQTNFSGAVQNLVANLDADQFSLRINRPSVSTTVQALQVKTGKTFDVIRRRRNAVLESYVVGSL